MENPCQQVEIYNLGSDDQCVVMKIAEIIIEEIRKVLNGFNIFTKYDGEDYNKANSQIHSLLEMIGK